MRLKVAMIFGKTPDRKEGHKGRGEREGSNAGPRERVGEAYVLGLTGYAGQQGVLHRKTPSWQRKPGLEMVNLIRRLGNKPTE